MNKKPYFLKKNRVGLAELPYNKLYEPIITDHSISMGAKVLFADIANLCKNRRKCCTASNQYFAKRYNVGTDTIKAWIKQLREAAYITSTGRRERKIYVSIKALRDFYFNGAETTSKEQSPIEVKITLYEKIDGKSPESIDSKEEETQNEDFLWC